MPQTRRGSHRVALWWALGAGAVCAGSAFLAAGTSGLIGAAIGSALVVAFLSTGPIPILLAGSGGVTAGMGAAVLLLTYTLRLALALVALVLLSQADVADQRWLGISVVVTALTWIAVHAAHAVLRSRHEPTVEPPS